MHTKVFLEYYYSEPTMNSFLIGLSFADWVSRPGPHWQWRCQSSWSARRCKVNVFL